MNTIPIRHKWEPYLWLLPSLLLMSIFVVFPIGIVFKLSLSQISKSGVVGGWNGVENFRAAFRDPAFGEWFGYLHRDGTVAQPAKGNLFKGPFHIPRMLIKSKMLCQEILSDE